MSNTVSQTILAQLGGNRFLAMTGAKNLTTGGNDLSFRLPGNPGFVRDGINYVKIELNGSDLYDVTFGRIHGTKYTVKATVEDLYFDSLQEVFTRYTGLETSLGTMRR